MLLLISIIAIQDIQPSGKVVDFRAQWPNGRGKKGPPMYLGREPFLVLIGSLCNTLMKT